jgi:vacuolar protein sorting-associated protein VTA1
MPLTIPTELKKITPYIRRAEELDRDKANAESRLVAYYCRQFAVHAGIALATSDTAKNCLGEILGALEGEKEAMDSFTWDEALFLCQAFADKIFYKADSEDRDGAATRNTAKTFYAAASFLEIIEQFYKDDDESEEFQEIKKRAVYAKWKATDILKAIKEGRDPTKGGYGESDAAEEEEEKEPQVDVPEELPQVETVSESDDEKEEKSEEEKSEEEKSEPMIRMPSPSPEPSSEEDNDDGEEEKGAEELGPPPPYRMEPDLPSSPAPAPAPLRPPLKFSPTAPPPPMPPAATTKPSHTPATEKKSGLFGFGGKKGTKATKAQLADAKELTQFALAALDDRNADLAAERLALALKALGR